MEYIGYFASILIGVALGLIGGGGSILTIPILVYLFQVNPKLATTYSLFVVGFTASIGAVQHYRMGNIKLKSAVLFAIPSLITLLLVRKIILPLVPETLFTFNGFLLTKDGFIMALFAVLMIAASYSMIKNSKEIFVTSDTNPLKVALIGALVGIATGFLGAGGGFLIIPVLLFFTGITMKQAVGTSILIISFNSLLGFLGDVVNGVTIDYEFLILVTAFATVGIFIGTLLSKKIDGNKLKPAFGWFVLVMGFYIITKELFLK
ncbi:putative membrane protein YfcA [Flavobacterium sp. CG_23.5]|uniref:sulfite exporter TauE/SafE family protein n=1 Tax=Flavobacterium sp. CG_23.5 TaxID=2760708 RepID=UPI001AE638FA|nr:sulfite exporter TauE/SafE family protein [Flavobacterium sp. CG_23.5]MBP2282439.1 putative membrane protein YfcA [Flavobacterium sp. CG_23.5]